MTYNILVVDDDDALRAMLAKGLKQVGFNVISAQSAEVATQILNRVSVDAVILDRMLNGIDGLTFLKQLRHSDDITPVIMLTALSGPENTIDGLSEGANDYMAKPFKLQELVLRLNNIIKTNKKNAAPNINIGISFLNGEYFAHKPDNTTTLLSLAESEKQLLSDLIKPVGNIVAGTPMVVKRLRNKIKGVLSDIDIVTVRGQGYKIIKKG